MFSRPVSCAVLFFLSLLLAPLLSAEEAAAPVYGPEVQKRLDELRAKGEPVTLEDLTPEPIPAEENAGTIYRQAFAAYVEGDDELLEIVHKGSRKPEEVGHVRRWVQQNERTLALVRQAAGMERCQFVDRYTGNYQEFPHLGKARRLAWLLRASAFLHCRGGNPELAIQDCLAGVRLGGHMGQGMMMLDNLAQRGIIAISLLSFRESLPEARLQPEEYRQIVHALRAALVNFSVRRALKGHRVLALDILSRPAQVKELITFEVDFRNPVHRVWLDAERIGVLDVHQMFLNWADKPFFEIADDMEKQPEAYVRSKVMPLPLTVLLTPHTMSIEGQARLRAELLQALLAVELEEHRQSSGAYPESLYELRLKHFEELPLDPFSGKPFRYEKRPGGYLLYSVGPNGKDDGGEPRTPGADGPDDIPWTVSRAGE